MSTSVVSRRRRDLLLVVLIVSTMVLSACGGGGGSSAAKSFTVTASAGPGGSISPGSRSVASGETATFTVTPNDGYSLESITGCGGTQNGGTYTTGPVTSACTVSATFRVNVYQVSTVLTGDGTISPTSIQVNHGSTATFTITADENHSIASVSGCNGSLAGDVYTTGAVTAACSVSAVIEINKYDVSTSTDGHGRFSPASARVEHGGTTVFTVLPNEGYLIDEVTGCGGALSGDRYTTGAITAACTVSATFSIKKYTVGTSAIGAGSINPDSAEVEHGSSAAFSLMPDAGYRVDTATGCSGTLQDLTYTTGPVKADCTVEIRFVGATVSGIVQAASGTAVDSDVNDPAAPYASNDTYESAQFVPDSVIVGGYVNVPGQGSSGRSYDFGDTLDVFRVRLRASEVVTLQMESSTDVSDLDLYLVSLDEEVVDASLGSASTTESVTVPVEAGEGEYYLLAHAWSGASNYLLTIGDPSVPAAVGARLTEAFVPGEAVVRFGDHVQTALGELEPLARSLGWMKGRDRERGQRSVLVKLNELEKIATGSLATSLAHAKQVGRVSSEAGPKFRVASAVVSKKLRTLYAIKALKSDPAVVAISPNYIYRPTLEPVDPLYQSQWHYPQINLPAAWDLSTGTGVVVGVVDSGVLLDHPDLAPHLLDGYDFINQIPGGADPGYEPRPADGSIFHGTHVAGTIAAVTGNAEGVAGVAFDARLVPVRVCTNGLCPGYAIEQGVRFAAGLPNDSGQTPTEPAGVINLSLGRDGGYSEVEQMLYNEVFAAGVVVVGAAGNSDVSTPHYPAAYDGVLSVASVGSDAQKAYYSNYGSWIDVAAPGGDVMTGGMVLSTYGNDAGAELEYTYEYLQGTSMAAPHMSGVVALIRSVAPHLTPTDISNLLSNGAITDDLGLLGQDDIFGHGLINAHKAVTAAINTNGQPVELLPRLAASPRPLRMGATPESRTVVLENVGGGVLTLGQPTNDSGGWLQVSIDGGQPPLAAGESAAATVTVDRTGLSLGVYVATVTFPSDANAAQVGVVMFVAQLSGTDVGTQYVLLVDPNSYETQKYTVARHLGGGKYEFSITDVAPGSYLLISGSDRDRNFVTCTAGESCGSYPTLEEPALIEVDGQDIGDLQFMSRYQPELFGPMSAQPSRISEPIAIKSP